MPAPTSAWALDRSLTNAKFESYKLSFDDDEDARKLRIPLASSSSSAALPGRTLRAIPDARLGYKEARSRARWNHLAKGKASQAGWIDAEGGFWLVDLSESSSKPSPRLITTLPQPISSSSSTNATAEYPVARYLRDDTWACTDGIGRLYLVDAPGGQITATYELLDPSTEALLPFCLHAVNLQDQSFVCLISATSAPPVNGKGKDKASYQVMLARVPLTSTGNDTQRLIPSVVLAGSDIPQYVQFTENECFVGASCRYRDQADSARPLSEETVPQQPTDSELVGIPQAAAMSEAVSKAPPPYSWTQDSDTVTVVFPLPSATSAKNIKVVFMPNAISVDVLTASDHARLPHLSSIKLWDTIDAGMSTWTWEKAGGDKGKYGILALHLEKKNEGTRWTSVFKASSDGNEGVDSSYLHVEETLDRSQLLQITEALEKYTSEQTSGAGTGLAGFEQRSSLVGDEFDADVDADERQSGKSLVFTVVDSLTSDAPRVVKDPRAEAADLLSVPFATAENSAGIVIKHDVDGLYFRLAAGDSSQWQHASTFPALGFVLASKRDVVQVFHYKDKLCIGLETGLPVASQTTGANRSYASFQGSKMNAYLYYPPPPGSKAKSAKQKVVGLADSQAGAVLGAIAIENADTVDIAVLCERELVVLQDVLR